MLLVVNVASAWGFTPQYTALEAVYEKYKDKGLVIVGVPANNFGNQESGGNAEIREFCSGKLHVGFPMMAKVSVKSGDKTPPITSSPQRPTLAARSSGTSPSFRRSI